MLERCRVTEAQYMSFSKLRNNSRFLRKTFQRIMGEAHNFFDKSFQYRKLDLYPLDFGNDWKLSGINEAIHFNSYDRNKK